MLVQAKLHHLADWLIWFGSTEMTYCQCQWLMDSTWVIIKLCSMQCSESGNGPLRIVLRVLCVFICM